jgi:hypothetical protein
MKTIGIFNMIAAYLCSVISVGAVIYYIALQMFANAFILSLAGFAMFMIAETLKGEWRKGKL